MMMKYHFKGNIRIYLLLFAYSAEGVDHKEYYLQDFRNNLILRVHASGKNNVKNSANGQKCSRNKREWNTLNVETV